ncbi:hypothetical protein GCM10009682_35920 [Luedemannella flava]|uniref:Uncharacterized protein n=1 Tax=Luedemannella flava TaxID=349316 RepID=A0ABP4YK21_9ACTN
MSDPHSYGQSPTAGPPVYGSAPVAPSAHGSAVVQPAAYGSAPAAAPPGSVPPVGVDTYGQYPPPPRRSRKGLWITLSVVLTIVIAAVVAGAVFLLPAITGALAEQNATLRTPDALVGFTKSTDPTRQATAEALKKQLAAEVTSETSSVAAFYEDPADPQKIVMVYGLTGKISSPAKELDDAFGGGSADGLVITDLRKVDAGPMSGEAKCGKGSSEGIDLVMCAWADHGSLGVTIFFNRDIDSSAALFKQIRNEVLVRN